MNADDGHHDLDQLLNDSLDGELDEAARAALDRRLAADPNTAREADAWRRLDVLLHNADRVVVDDRAFLAEHRRRRLTAPAVTTNVRIYRWLVPLAAAAAILIAVFVSLPVRHENGRRTVAQAPTATPQQVAPPTIDIRYGKAPGTPAADQEAPIIEVKFARRDTAMAPPVTQPPAIAANEPRPVAFAVVSAGGNRISSPPAEAPPI